VESVTTLLWKVKESGKVCSASQYTCLPGAFFPRLRSALIGLGVQLFLIMRIAILNVSLCKFLNYFVFRLTNRLTG
jgi:hypothetical protein